MLTRTKTTVNIPEVPSEVAMETGTLRDVFKKVFGNTHFAKEIIDPRTGEISFDSLFDVRLNDVPYYTLSQGLDTELRDGDTVTLF
jgi:molybdopterin converting factor small subunit